MLLVVSSTLVVIENQNNQRQECFASVDRLVNDDSLTIEEANMCANVIFSAVDAGVITYNGLGLGSKFTVLEMVKHVEWGCQMEPTGGY